MPNINTAPSFAPPNGTGKKLIPVGTTDDYGQAIAIQSDGKMVVAGYSFSATTGNDFSVVRLNEDGSLDPTFNGTGKNILSVGGAGAHEYAYDVAIQADGGIVLVGTNVSDFKVVRLKPDGTLDTAFNNGVSLIQVGNNLDRAFGVVVQPDGKIVVAGNSDVGGSYDFSVVRLISTGVLDNEFGSDRSGKVVIQNFGGVSLFDGGQGIALQDGKILLAGAANITGTTKGHDFALVRLDANGLLDPDFGDSGKKTFQVASGNNEDFGKNVLVQTDGKILIAGRSVVGSRDFSVIRLEQNGDVDPSFGNAGKTFIDVGGTNDADFFSGMALQSDGAILLSGYSEASADQVYEFSLIRLHADGNVDTAFNEKVKDAIHIGLSSFKFLSLGDPNALDRTSVKVQSDGKIVLVGDINSGVGTVTDYDFAVIRLNIDGSLDTTFNSTAFNNTLDGTFSYTEDLAAIALDTTVAVFDAELAALNGGLGNYAGASITLQRQGGADATDEFSAREELVFSGGNALLSGTSVGTVSTSDGTLTITFNDKATQAVVNEVVSSLAYASSSNAPPASLLIDWTIDDGSQSTTGALSATKTTTVNITPRNDLPTEFTILGTAQQGNDLGFSNLTDPDGIPDGALHYQWKADGVAIADATGPSLALTQNQVGKAITLTLSYTDAYGTSEVVTSAQTTGVENVNDLPTGDVIISGLAEQGQILSAAHTLKDIDGLGEIQYQWKSADANIDGATESTLTLTQDQVGKTVSVVASYTDDFGRLESVPSNAALTVENVNDAPTGSLTITGSASLDETLKFENFLTDADGLVDATMAYQWKANGANIGAATGTTYKLTQAEIGKVITVTASYTDDFGNAESATSAPTSTVAANSLPTGSVTITGTATQNETLTASHSLVDVNDMGPVNYQWMANDTNIVGATGSILLLTEAQVGKRISVTASYTDGHGTAESVTSTASSAVTNVNDLPTGTVTLAGTPTQNQTLTASNTLDDDDGLGAITYQWNANGTAIAGATDSTFVLTQTQVGKTITVTANYTDGHGTDEAPTSAASTEVANSNDAPTGLVAISGNTSSGQILTASNTLVDADGLGAISYQWLADDIAIVGATSGTLVLAEDQVGKTITVTASYTDDFGKPESVDSAPTAVISIPPQTVTGTVDNDNALTGGAGNDTIDGLDGLDTAVYTTRFAGYTLSAIANGHSITGPDGADTLTSIERLHFLDANLAFDLDGNAGQVYRLYKAAFARTPDMSGLGSWINAMDNGDTLEQVANAFVDSGEFQALYGTNSSNETFVMLLYLNALGRAPAPSEVPGWANQLAMGVISRAQMLAHFSEDAENKNAVSASIANGILYAATSEQSTMAEQGLSLAGTANADTLYGSIGNDRFSGLSEFDFAFGSKGIDTAVYGGNRADYEIVRADNDTLYVNDSDGKTSTLSSIERLQFADTILAFDTSGNAGQVYRLYQAAFDRTPGPTELSGWISEADKGTTLQKMASAFIASKEFQTLYGANPSHSDFVTSLYRNAMNREPDDGGKAYWVEQLGNGLTREMALIGFSESDENQAALIGVMQGGIEYSAV